MHNIKKSHRYVEWLCRIWKQITNNNFIWLYIMLYYFHFPISGWICKTASNNSKSVCYYYNLARLQFTYIIKCLYIVSIGARIKTMHQDSCILFYFFIWWLWSGRPAKSLGYLNIESLLIFICNFFEFKICNLNTTRWLLHVYYP